MSLDSMTADMALANFSRELGYTQLKKENPKCWLVSVKTEGVGRLGIQKQGEPCYRRKSAYKEVTRQ